MTRVGIFIFIFSTLFPYRTFAVTGKDSWESIRNTPGLIILQPQFSQVFGTKGLFNACATNEQFRNIDPVQSCPGNKSDGCIEYTLQQVSVERLFHRNICTERQYEKCMNYNTVIESYPASYYLPVLEKKTDGSKVLLFSKNFTVPDCE